MENLLTATLPSPVTPLPLAAPRSRSRTLLWVARGLTGLVAAFLLVDAGAKLIAIAPVVEATQRLGYTVGIIRPLGFLLAAFTLLHLFPRTQLVGALLLTAYLGGATATLVRAGTPFWFPVVMGAILWLTYLVRSSELRGLLFSTQTRKTR